ncbi:MAG: hypothetical protein MRY79_06125 [Alphaproteobacteria bacterium]|nr:hypothetical protein [Alphaproteobacteria bacterium]
MRNKRLFIIFLIFSIVFVSLGFRQVWAQECDISEEEIVTLKEPDFTTPKQWESIYGKDGLDQFTDLSLPFSKSRESIKEDSKVDLNVVAAGEHMAGGVREVFNPLLVHLDKKGKPVWEVRPTRSKDQTVEKFLQAKSSYVLFGNIQKTKRYGGIYVARYGSKGQKISERAIFSDEGVLKARGIIETADKKGFVLAAELIPKGTGYQSKAVLYKVLKDGTLVWRRVYSPGPRAVFHDIHLVDFGGYIITGEIEGEDGRTAAWLLHMRDNGALNWQKEYYRGRAARFTKALVNDQGEIAVLGTIDPHGKANHKSSWLAVMDVEGNILWQRYYESDYRMIAKDMFYYPDGRLFILIDFYPVRSSISQKLKGERPRGHSRILSLSPRGSLLDVQSYSAGVHAHASAMVKDIYGSILVAGSVQNKLPDGMDPKKLSSSIFDGWVFQTPPIDDYADPCALDPEF